MIEFCPKCDTLSPAASISCKHFCRLINKMKHTNVFFAAGEHLLREDYLQEVTDFLEGPLPGYINLWVMFWKGRREYHDRLGKSEALAIITDAVHTIKDSSPSEKALMTRDYRKFYSATPLGWSVC